MKQSEDILSNLQPPSERETQIQLDGIEIMHILFPLLGKLLNNGINANTMIMCEFSGLIPAMR